MSVEGIKDRIIADAKKEAENIINHAKEEAKSIIETGKREAQEYFGKRRKLLEDEYRKEKERAILNKRLELRKKLLEARQVWMDRAFADAYKRLVDQDLKEYKDLMVQLISKVSRSRDEEIIFGKKGEDVYLKEIVDELNEKTKGDFTLSKARRDFPWGFVLKRGSVETNMSINSLFKYKRNDLEQKAWELFNADL